MAYKRDKRIDGEYDPPLPKRVANPTQADREKMEKLIQKYENMKRQRFKA